MKTLEELVDKLNKLQDEDDFLSKFVIRREDEMDRVFVSKFLLNEHTIVYKDLFEYNYRLKGWLICSDLMYMNGAIQKVVVDFLSEFHDKSYDYIYGKKKYNIVIGQSKVISEGNETIFLTAYFKNLYYSSFETNDTTNEDMLSEEKYQFTSREIEDLKSTLPIYMRTIVDLSKIEVEDD